MYFSSFVATSLALAPALVAALPATGTTTSSTCPCASTAAPAPTASTSSLVCGKKAAVQKSGVIPVNTGGTGPVTTVDLIETCANICFSQYSSVCDSFSVSAVPYGYTCNIFAYTIAELNLTDNSAGAAYYDKSCYEPTCPYDSSPNATSTCPPNPTTTDSNGYATCTCAALATPYPYNQVGTTCGQYGTVTATQTPIATSVSPYTSADGYSASANQVAANEFCGRACLLDADCNSFKVSQESDGTCYLYGSSLSGAGFVSNSSLTSEDYYDKGCWRLECNSGITGC